MELANHFYLSLGSNLGNRIQNLRNAVNKIKKLPCKIIQVSSVYQTSAIGIENAPDFLNVCIYGKTNTEVLHFLKELLNIEHKLGRKREGNTPISRSIDIDIILFNEYIIDNETINIPHPRFKNRKFVLVPLLEINPNLLDPRTLIPISAYLRTTTDHSTIKKLDDRLFD